MSDPRRADRPAGARPGGTRPGGTRAGGIRVDGVRREAAAVAAVLLGVVVPLLGPVVAVVLVVLARRWTPAEKALGALASLAWPALVLLLLVPADVCWGPGGGGASSVELCPGALDPLVGVPLLAVLLALPVVVAVLLLGRARERADAARPAPR